MSSKRIKKVAEKPAAKADLVTKTISLPEDLFSKADAKVQSTPEPNWSQYVRGLIRKDLANKETIAA